jgi:two-component system chemotaxis response regulator CheY
MAYRILIVDDSPAMRAFVRRVLDLSGFDVEECREAANGQEALDLLKCERIHAILTDINMPTMDGEEFLTRLAADEGLKSIPAVVISTDATGKRIERMKALGARGYVAKPFRPEDLRAEIERSLGEAQ